MLILVAMKKEDMVAACRKVLEQRVEECRHSLSALQADLTSESKSTAGDKHETGRAMLHLEAEKEAARLHDAESLLLQWERIDFNHPSAAVVPGALVHTSEGHFLISVPLGRVDLSDLSVFLISPVSPLGKLLQHQPKGATITLNGKTFTILAIS